MSNNKQSIFYRNIMNLDEEIRVIVTHINSPSLFYCRIENDVEHYEQLKCLINKYVNNIDDEIENNDNINNNKQINFIDLIIRKNFSTILIYSDIHNEWCRAKLISIKSDRNHKPIYAKVLLIDFGSIEFISWKPNQTIMNSSIEINNFNDSCGLCFPCSFDNIKPYNNNDGDDNRSENDQNLLKHEWTSYANFLFKNETKNFQKFLLKKIYNPKIFKNDKIIVCDLLPLNNNDDEVDCSSIKYKSICNFLVESKVARYIE